MPAFFAKTISYIKRAVIALFNIKTLRGIRFTFFVGIIAFGVLAVSHPVFAEPSSVGGDVADWMVTGVTEIMLTIARLAIGLCIFFLHFFITLASYNNYINTPVVQVGWIMVRDVANMFFVVTLLVIAFGTILGLEQYEWKKGMAKLILGAIFINFSNLLAQLVIDVAHVFTITFLNAIAAAAGGNLIQMFHLTEILSFVQNPKTEGVSNVRLELLGGAIMAVIFAVFAAVAMFAYVLAMMARVVLLWVLIIMSPLAFIWQVLPATQGYAERWGKEFKEQIIVAPIMVFFLWLTFATLGTGTVIRDIQNGDGGKSTVIPLQSEATEELSVSISKISSWERMASFLVAITFLFIGIKEVGETGAVGSRIIGSAMDFGKKVATIGTGYAAGRWLVGKGVDMAKTTAMAPVKGAGWLAKKGAMTFGGDTIVAKAKNWKASTALWIAAKGTQMTKKGEMIRDQAIKKEEQVAEIDKQLENKDLTPEQRQKKEQEKVSLKAEIAQHADDMQYETAGGPIGMLARRRVKIDKQLKKTEDELETEKKILWKSVGSNAGGNVLFGAGMGTGTSGIGFGFAARDLNKAAAEREKQTKAIDEEISAVQKGDGTEAEKANKIENLVAKKKQIGGTGLLRAGASVARFFNIAGDDYVLDEELGKLRFGEKGIKAKDRVKRGMLKAEEARSAAKDEEYESMGQYRQLLAPRLKYDVTKGTMGYEAQNGSMQNVITNHKLAAETIQGKMKALEGRSRMNVAVNFEIKNKEEEAARLKLSDAKTQLLTAQNATPESIQAEISEKQRRLAGAGKEGDMEYDALQDQIRLLKLIEDILASGNDDEHKNEMLAKLFKDQMLDPMQEITAGLFDPNADLTDEQKKKITELEGEKAGVQALEISNELSEEDKVHGIAQIDAEINQIKDPVLRRKAELDRQQSIVGTDYLDASQEDKRKIRIIKQNETVVTSARTEIEEIDRQLSRIAPGTKAPKQIKLREKLANQKKGKLEEIAKAEKTITENKEGLTAVTSEGKKKAKKRINTLDAELTFLAKPEAEQKAERERLSRRQQLYVQARSLLGTEDESGNFVPKNLAQMQQADQTQQIQRQRELLELSRDGFKPGTPERAKIEQEITDLGELAKLGNEKNEDGTEKTAEEKVAAKREFDRRIQQTRIAPLQKEVVHLEHEYERAEKATKDTAYSKFLHSKVDSEEVGHILHSLEERLFDAEKKKEYSEANKLNNAGKMIERGDFADDVKKKQAEIDRLNTEMNKKRSATSGTLVQRELDLGKAKKANQDEIDRLKGPLVAIEQRMSRAVEELAQIQDALIKTPEGNEKGKLNAKKGELEGKIRLIEAEKTQAETKLQDIAVGEDGKNLTNEAGEEITKEQRIGTLEAKRKETDLEIVRVQSQIREEEKKMEGADPAYKQLKVQKSALESEVKDTQEGRLKSQAERLRNGDKSVANEVIGVLKARMNKIDDTLEKQKIVREIQEWEELMHHLKGASLSWQYGVATARQKSEAEGLKYEHNLLLSTSEQQAIHNERGLDTPVTTLTEIIEGYSKSYADMPIEKFIANVGPMLTKMMEKNKKGTLTQQDRAALMGLFKRGLDRSWVDDAIEGIMTNEKSKELIGDQLGWKDMIYTDDKIRDIQMLFATAGDVDFVKQNGVMSYMQDVGQNDYGMGQKDIFEGMKTGVFRNKAGNDVTKEFQGKVDALLGSNGYKFGEDQKKLFHSFFGKMSDGTQADVQQIDELQKMRRQAVESYMYKTRARQSEFQFLGNLRELALKSGHPENAGYALSRDVGGGESLFMGMGLRSARGHVMGDARKMNARDRHGMQSHAFGYLDEQNGQVMTDLHQDKYGDLMSGIDYNSFSSINARGMKHFIGLSGSDRESDFQESDGSFHAAKMTNADGTMSSAAKSWTKILSTDTEYSSRFAKAATQDEQEALMAEAQMNRLFAPQMRGNLGAFTMLLGKAGGVNHRESFNRGTIKLSMYNPTERKLKHYDNINQLIVDYNAGDWNQGKAPKSIPPFRQQSAEDISSKERV